MSDPRPPDVTALLLAWCGAIRQPSRHHRRRRTATTGAPLHAPGTSRPHAATGGACGRAYVRLVDVTRVRWQNRSHFFGVSARLMRQILVDVARERGAAKRGEGAPHVSLDADAIPVEGRDDDFIALDEALSLLAETDARKAQVVEMRFFGGLTVEETAEALAVSPETVKRDGSPAKAWLRRQLTA